MKIDDISNAVAGVAVARASLKDIIDQIEKLETEKLRIANAPPHTDDITAAYMRGLDAATSMFEKRLLHHLNDPNATHPSAAQSISLAAPQVLTVGRVRGYSGLFPSSRLDQGNGLMDLAAVTYFLRDRIAADIPALVKRFCPASEQGMKQADREDALAALDEEIARLEQDRDVLTGSLEAARRAASIS